MLVFVGEERSGKAKSMGVHWQDGRLAAKQLFDALRSNGIDPKQCAFVNLFEDDGVLAVALYAASGYKVIGMGRKVQRALTALGFRHTAMVHPAARGSIRKKHRYISHVSEVLKCSTI